MFLRILLQIKAADGIFCVSQALPNTKMSSIIPAARTKKRILMYFTHMFINAELRNSMTDDANCLPEKLSSTGRGSTILWSVKLFLTNNIVILIF